MTLFIFEEQNKSKICIPSNRIQAIVLNMSNQDDLKIEIYNDCMRYNPYTMRYSTVAELEQKFQHLISQWQR